MRDRHGSISVIERGSSCRATRTKERLQLPKTKPITTVIICNHICRSCWCWPDRKNTSQRIRLPHSFRIHDLPASLTRTNSNYEDVELLRFLNPVNRSSSWPIHPFYSPDFPTFPLSRPGQKPAEQSRTSQSTDRLKKPKRFRLYIHPDGLSWALSVPALPFERDSMSVSLPLQNVLSLVR
jgi:hypothetical protein